MLQKFLSNNIFKVDVNCGIRLTIMSRSFKSHNEKHVIKLVKPTLSRRYFSNYKIRKCFPLSIVSLPNTRGISYVSRMKLLDNLKQEPLSDVAAEAFQKGKYLLFKNKNVFIDKNCLGDLNDGASQKFQSYEIIWLNFEDIRKFKLDSTINEKSGLGDCCVLLNMDEDGTPLFVLQFDQLEDQVERELEEHFNGTFVSIEVAMFLGSTRKSASVEQAQSMLKWHKQFQYCYLCGGTLLPNTIGLQKSCSNCSKVHYPKPDPAVITVVTDETNNKCLLVRQKQFPKGMYTAIAGFLEMGENIEDTVRREVAEEVGLQVAKIDYVTSQHWPLKGSTLMIGCLAIVEPGHVELDKKEIEDARWFSADELTLALNFISDNPAVRLKIKEAKKRMFWVPPKPTIANFLLTSWLEKYSKS